MKIESFVIHTGENKVTLFPGVRLLTADVDDDEVKVFYFDEGGRFDPVDIYFYVVAEGTDAPERANYWTSVRTSDGFIKFVFMRTDQPARKPIVVEMDPDTGEQIKDR